MMTIWASRFSKFLEAFSYFTDKVLIEPNGEWLTIGAMDRLHITAAFGKLRLEEPIYEKFGIDLRKVLRFLKQIHGEAVLRLENRKLILEGHDFLVKIDTIDPKALKPISEPILSFVLSADVEISLLVDILKRLKKTDEITFIADKDGLRIEAETGTSRYSQWLGTPSFKAEEEVKVKFAVQFLSQIVRALETLSRPPNATFTKVELRTNYPARFILTDKDLEFKTYIAPRVD
jgi:hypothetical protein